MNLHFEKAAPHHQDTIFQWLAEPHMIEFWDNSQDHKNDILNFIHGRKQTYFYGTTQYWIGLMDNTPFSFILSDIFLEHQGLSKAHKRHLSPSGHTIGLDFGIGNTDYLGKGLSAPTLDAFVHFYQGQVDPLADTFFIDPDANNPRACHVYGKAGFQYVGDYNVQAGAFVGHISHLMVRKLHMQP